MIQGLTHEQYLDEPAETVAWTLAINDTVAEINRARQRREANARK